MNPLLIIFKLHIYYTIVAAKITCRRSHDFQSKWKLTTMTIILLMFKVEEMVIEKKDTLLKDEAKVTRVDKDIQMRKEVSRRVFRY